MQMPNYNAELDDYKPSANQNMSTLVSSSLEQDLKKQILGRSEAEKTFRPWWDTVEDYLLNALVLLGKQKDLNFVLELIVAKKWNSYEFGVFLEDELQIK